VSYELFVDGKISGEISTNFGFYRMARFCGTRGVQLKAFFEDGQSTDPAGLRDELNAVLDNADDPPADDVKECIQMLLKRLDGIDRGKITARN
jgi:hypothetical protein